MKKVWTILPAVAVFAAVPAYAQNMGFSPRIELRAGHDELRAEVEIEDGAFTEDVSENGIGYGVEAGVDFQVTSTLLVGAYAGIDLSSIDDCSEAFTDVFDSAETCIKAGRNFTAGARAGLPLGDGGLIYVKGGYSNAKIEASFIDDTTDVDSQLFSDSETVAGYHLGAGFELGLGVLGLGDNFYIKGEYVHTRYKNAFKSQFSDGESFDPTRHQLLAGFGIRFGGRAAPVVIAPPPPLPPLMVEPAPLPPATQTCADGSVILATDVCPPVYVPPPPPPVEPERG